MSDFWYVKEPVLEMRMEPSRTSEVDSQALFSEQVFLLDEAEGWQKIATAVDRYQGWVRRGGIVQRAQPLQSSSEDTLVVNRQAAHLYHTTDTIYGPIVTLPFESRLRIKEKINARWFKVSLPDNSEAFVQSGDVSHYTKKPLSLQQVSEFSHRFLGIPYTWGGRSSFGYDCSGFVQMLYRQMGIALPRNSSQQFKCDRASSISLKELQMGDLLFWGADAQTIQHVGFCLDDCHFIHTSAVTENMPWVRVSSILDPEWAGLGYYPYLTACRIHSCVA